MAIETKTTNSPEADSKSGNATPEKRRPRRRRATPAKKSAPKPDTDESPAGGAESAAAKQVDIGEIASSRDPASEAAVATKSARAASRVRVRQTDSGGSPAPADAEPADGGPSSEAATPSTEGAENAPAKKASEKPARRRASRSRRGKKNDASAAAGPAEATEPKQSETPTASGGEAATAAEVPARSPDSPSSAPVEDKAGGHAGSAPSSGTATADRPGSSPRSEGKPGDERRRRRGRRGRRGGQKADASPAVAATPAAKPADTVAEPAESDEVDELDMDVEALGADLELSPYVDRKGKDRSAGRELIVNVSTGSECRVAVLHEGRLEELFMERDSTLSHVGNIYKGRVTNVEPSIQAAFVDFGLEKNGFLHVSDVQPQYFPNHAGATEDVGRKIPRHQRPPIQKCFRRGQEVIVQITKEGVGTKGPTLTSYLSIPGRYLVMMPGMSHAGVSRKIEDEDDRKRMRDILAQLTLPKGMGFILRTAGLDRPKRELQRDLNYLTRLWKTVVERIKSQRSPAELYRESDLVIRTLRDVYTTDFSRIVVDDAATAKKIREFVRIAMPRTKVPIELYADREPLFHRLGIEAEIERINMRHVPLASGGSVVIDSTEAMVAIDVNSGRFRTFDDAEETAVRINIEAAEEIARQLRLRDLGGLIVCDFIDMRLERNKRRVEQALRDALKKHKERARTLRMSAFGLIEMTRQRQGPSIRRNLYHDCPHCRGSGQVKMPESVMLDAMRMLQLAAHHKEVAKITLWLAPEVAFSLLNRKRIVLQQIEDETGKRIVVSGKSDFTSDQIQILCEDNRGREVAIGGGAGTM